MAKSEEELRRAMDRIRENLGRKAPAAPASPAPKSSAPLLLDSPRAREEDAAPPPRRRALARPEPIKARPEGFVWRPWAKAGGLCMAAAGAGLGSTALLSAGLAILAAEQLAAIVFPVDASRDISDVLPRLAALERRAQSPEASGAPRELQEDIRELRGMVRSLYAVLEKPSAEEDSGDGGDPF